ncbi:MAG: hypothetical protein H6745_32530 [Deltaproteobacteria bacterium]|nr:hypothetical protein [Deltaproteobacteria bacterium]
MTREEAAEVLGVAPHAAGDVLRRAYLRAVRRHPPEADPAGFQRVREAYELLTGGVSAARVAATPRRAPAAAPAGPPDPREGDVVAEAPPDELARTPVPGAMRRPELAELVRDAAEGPFETLAARVAEIEARLAAAPVELDDVPADLLGRVVMRLAGIGAGDAAARLVALGDAAGAGRIGPERVAPVDWLLARELVVVRERVGDDAWRLIARRLYLGERVAAGSTLFMALEGAGLDIDAMRGSVPLLRSLAVTAATRLDLRPRSHAGWWFGAFVAMLVVVGLVADRGSRQGDGPPRRARRPASYVASVDPAWQAADVALAEATRGCAAADRALCDAVDSARGEHIQWRCDSALSILEHAARAWRARPPTARERAVIAAQTKLSRYCAERFRDRRAAP